MALAILSIVLLSSTVVTTQAFRLGQTARERTVIADDAQSQVEALRSFRDNHTWDEFLNGGWIGAARFSGVINGAGPGGCRFSSPCFFMKLRSFGPVIAEYLPAPGSTIGTVPTSYMEISVTPITPTKVDVILSYGFTELGGQTQATGHIKTTLTDIGLKP